MSPTHTSMHQPDTVTCYCFPPEKCTNRLDQCVSTTGCFQSILFDKSLSKILDESYGCFPNNTDQLKLHCHQPLVSQHYHECCTPADGNFCNKNLNKYGSRHFAIYDLQSIFLTIVLPLLTLLLGLSSIAALWYNCLKPRLAGRTKNSMTSSPNCDIELVNTRSSVATSSKCHRSFISCCFIAKNKLQFPSLFNPVPFASGQGRVRVVDKATTQPHSTTTPSAPVLELSNLTSGSGSGVPFLVQRTIARHIQLIECVGKGRFGEVWRATCHDEIVAVKIFSSRDEVSWARETEVYNSGLFHHPNLLAFYASDMISRGGCTQLWLITAYHPLGSLYDYLVNGRHSFQLTDSLRFSRSICSGLGFLHMQTKGLYNKPAVAHRDIKSKNILVRSNREACIADLGLALVQQQQNSTSPDTSPRRLDDRFFFSHNSSSGAPFGTWANSSVGMSSGSVGGPPPPAAAGPRVGTKRYMAPELLLASSIDSTCTNRLCRQRDDRQPMIGLLDNIDSEQDSSDELASTILQPLPFEVYQAADVYALGLVLWEIMRCTCGSTPVSCDPDRYQIPFQDLVPPDPSFGQMRQLVCGTGTLASRRPPVSQRWSLDPVMTHTEPLLAQCWADNWLDRPSAPALRKRIEQLEEETSCSTPSFGA